jgi:hypothetical protein
LGGEPGEAGCDFERADGVEDGAEGKERRRRERLREVEEVERVI